MTADAVGDAGCFGTPRFFARGGRHQLIRRATDWHAPAINISVFPNQRRDVDAAAPGPNP